MNREELKTMYIKLSLHPSFLKLSERYQDMISLWASGATSREVSAAFGLAPRSASTNRHTIFKQMGFKVYENRGVRAMHSEEVMAKLKSQNDSKTK